MNTLARMGQLPIAMRCFGPLYRFALSSIVDPSISPTKGLGQGLHVRPTGVNICMRQDVREIPHSRTSGSVTIERLTVRHELNVIGSRVVSSSSGTRVGTAAAAVQSDGVKRPAKCVAHFTWAVRGRAKDVSLLLYAGSWLNPHLSVAQVGPAGLKQAVDVHWTNIADHEVMFGAIQIATQP